MNTIADLKKRILLLLGDDVASGTGEPIYGGQYSEDALLAGIHAALDAILPWVWKKQVFALTITPDNGYTFTLPDDFYQVEGIVLSTKTLNDIVVYSIIPRMEVFSAGRIPNIDEPYFLLLPEGKIAFAYKIDITAGAKLFYAATWTKSNTDETALETPAYALTALSYYAAAHCLLGKAVSAANIRQYGTKVDSGSPEDNPLLSASTYLQRVFDIAVQRLPTMPRGAMQ